jgi:hypothetical protein
MIKKSKEEISSVVWYSMELSSSLTYFLRRLPKTRRYTLKCVRCPPAEGQGPTPFRKIQVKDLLYLQILIVIPYAM